jgi:hypothetical protein
MFYFQNMKTTFLLVVVTVFSFNIRAQEHIDYSHLPDPVKRFFPSVYPLDDSVSVLWSYEDSLYVARFSDAGYPVEVLFKKNGYWVNTFLYIDYSFAPESIRQYVEEQYSGHHILKCAISNNAVNERNYNIILKNPEGAEIKARFTLEGKFIQ